MPRPRLKLALPALLALAWAQAQAGPIWVLQWSDEFGGAADAPPDSSKWSYDLGAWGWGNNELQDYRSSTLNARTDGAGELIIEARADGSSARIRTQGKFSQRYGRFEARLRLPFGQGIWPAFWMLGEDIGSSGWPACGEIDVMEAVGFEPNIVHGTIHGPGYSGSGGLNTPYDTGSPVSSAYHLYAMEWEPGIIRWYVDNAYYAYQTRSTIPMGQPWPFDQPFFLILNLAIGGDWPGYPDSSTSFPQFLRADYVRAYARDSTLRPLNGAPWPIPGQIEAEDFDDGGPGVAYADSSPQNEGGFNVTRTSEAVDLGPCSDAGGGWNLGWAMPGEWLNYSVDVAAPGYYALELRSASAGSGGAVHFELDGSPLAGGAFSIPATGGWQSWRTLTQTLSLPAGPHSLKLAIDSGSSVGSACNINWFRFSAITPTLTPTPVPPGSSATITPSPTPMSFAPGSPLILDARPVPNPQSGAALSLSLLLSRPCPALRLRLYGPSLALVAESRLSAPSGRSQLSFALPNHPNGLYFYRLDSIDPHGSRSGKVMLLN